MTVMLSPAVWLCGNNKLWQEVRNSILTFCKVSFVFHKTDAVDRTAFITILSETPEDYTSLLSLLESYAFVVSLQFSYFCETVL